jgi:hypothetical protein
MDQDVERLKICLHVFGCPAHIVGQLLQWRKQMTTFTRSQLPTIHPLY